MEALWKKTNLDTEQMSKLEALLVNYSRVRKVQYEELYEQILMQVLELKNTGEIAKRILDDMDIYSTLTTAEDKVKYFPKTLSIGQNRKLLVPSAFVNAT